MKQVLISNRLPILNKYFNGGYFTAAEGIAASITPGLIFSKNAGVIMNLQNETDQSSVSKTEIPVPFYTGMNENVLEMIDALDRLRDTVAFAILHGSLADGNETTYSDFDALIIIRDEVFTDRTKLVKTATAVNSLRTFMHRHDPLQHHGWFVLTESDLKNYPQEFLPVETLIHGRSLMKGNELLIVHPKENPDWLHGFHRLCRSISNKLAASPESYSLFQIKAVLSEFMMLPVLYVQARDKKGIYKKYAFAEMRKDFTSDEFMAMDLVSEIRKNWSVTLSSRDRVFLERCDFISWRKRKKMELPVPSFIHDQFNEELFLRMKVLVTEAVRKIS